MKRKRPRSLGMSQSTNLESSRIQHNVGGRPWRMNPIAAAVMCACSSVSALPIVQAQESVLLEEIMVTAQRRDQSIQDIPYNISAYTSDDLDAARAYNLGDISRLVPGLSYVDQGGTIRANRSTFILRGINATDGILSFNSDVGLPPVSMYFGDTPLFFPIAMKDLERVEVLRGPQGTLYGSGSLGGTIRFIPKKPSLDAFYFETNGHVDTMSKSGEVGYGIDAVVNVPLVDGKLAFRVVGSWDDLGGFINANALASLDSNGVPVPSVSGDPTSGIVLESEEDTNDEEIAMIRASLLWVPNDTFDATISYITQTSEADDIQAANPNFSGGLIDYSLANFPGSLFTNAAGCINGTVAIFGFLNNACTGPNAETFFPNGGTIYPRVGEFEHTFLAKSPQKSEVDIFNAEVNIDFGFASFSSSTSYMEKELNNTVDQTGFSIPTRVPGTSSFSSYYGFYPRMFGPLDARSDTERFVQEFRLVSTWDKKFDYVVGVYYEDMELSDSAFQLVPGVSAYDDVTNVALFGFPLGFNNATNPDEVFSEDRQYEFKDTSVYGEFTWHVSDQWQLTGGIRIYDQEFIHAFTVLLPFCGIFCSTDPDNDPNALLGGTTLPAEKRDFDGEIFKFNTSYDFSDSLMGYFTWSEGFRRGGANTFPQGGFQASLPELLEFSPDKSTNWELGIKGTLRDRIRYSTAIFYIDWEDFQFEGNSNGGFRGVFNGIEARSQGFEIEVDSNLTDNLAFKIGYAYVDAEATQDFDLIDYTFGVGSPVGPVLSVKKGDPLPNVPEHTLSVGLNYQQWMRSNAWSLVYHVDGSYRSETQSTFNASIYDGRDFYVVDAYSIWNASITLNSDANWYVSLFIKNIGNEDGLTGGVPSGFFGATHNYFFTFRPRTIGLGFGYRYE